MSLLLLIVLSVPMFSSCDTVNTSNPNSIEQCKYKVITTARTFYTNSYDTGLNGAPILHGFFSNEGGKWVWYPDDFEVSKQAWGEAKIIIQGGPEDKETYVLPPAGLISGGRATIQLTTIKRWQGTESTEILYKVEKTPCVINGWYESNSQIKTVFSMNIGYPSKTNGVEAFYFTYMSPSGVLATTVEEKETITIHIKASGVKWWVKLGIE
jgi:hypothetical protein